MGCKLSINKQAVSQDPSNKGVEAAMASLAAVTFKVANHPANPVQISASNAAGDLVRNLKEYRDEGCGQVLQATPGLAGDSRLVPSNNGFVNGVVDAYCRHHNLIIRPDDVWVAILIQFGFYVNANAEALRSLFVAHEGKKQIIVYQDASLHTADYGLLARDTVSVLRENLTDPDFCNWVLPRFSTTTHNDTIVASVALMATMKHYFDYTFCITCGIPEITLSGTVEDWEEIYARIEKLRRGGYGEVCTSWAFMLEKIVSQFIKTSKKEIDLEFWSRICHYTSGGSGPSYLSGWITAFCVFDGQGKWQATQFSIPRGLEICEPQQVSEFPVIDTSNIPPGYITVNVKVDDNGREYMTVMFAGHMGYDIVHDGKGIAPKLAWAIAVKSPRW